MNISLRFRQNVPAKKGEDFFLVFTLFQIKMAYEMYKK